MAAQKKAAKLIAVTLKEDAAKAKLDSEAAKILVSAANRGDEA